MFNSIIEEIQKIVLDGKIISTKKLPREFIKYSDNVDNSFNVYKIPVSLLRYNKNNGRISSLISDKNIFQNLSNLEIESRIENFIVNSDINAHNKTKNNIKLNTQQEAGIILDNGIVIDGNRRFTCLRQLNRENPNEEDFEFFYAVVLKSDSISDKEIKILELAIQMGRDEKVNYDPIERALDSFNKIEIEKLLTINEYSEAAQISKNDLNKNINVIKLIKEYLEYIKQDNNFSIIKEEQKWEHFIELNSILKKLSNNLKKQDEIKYVGFDYILASPFSTDSKKLRKLLQSLYSIKNNNDIEFFLNNHVDSNINIKEKIENIDNYKQLKENLSNDKNLLKSLEKNKINIIYKDEQNKYLKMNDLGDLAWDLYDDINKKFNKDEIKYYQKSEILNLSQAFRSLKELLNEKILILEKEMNQNDK